MKASAATVDDYLNGLPADRREVLNAVRKVILANLPKGYQECMNYGMIGYVVPHTLYPKGYHCNPKLPLPFAALGAQKNHMALHLMSVYGNAPLQEWFRKAWLATGKKLDMGKACVRFKRLEEVPLEVIGQVVARSSVADYISCIESAMGTASSAKRGKAKARSAKR